MSQTEYSNSSVSKSCAYRKLGDSNFKEVAAGPQQQLSGTRSITILPSFGIPGYVKLSQDKPTCAGYNTFKGAYTSTCEYVKDIE